jgi:hypothetical protein
MTDERQAMDLFSTVVVDSNSPRELIWFSYSVGQPIPHGRPANSRVSSGPHDLAATRDDTNMMVANTLVDHRMLLKACAIRIPVRASYEYQTCGLGYTVTETDVANFCKHAIMHLFIGGAVPWVELTPTTTRVYTVPSVLNIETGVSSGSFSEKQWPSSDERGMLPVFVRGPEKPVAFERVCVLPEPILVNRIEKFWAELSWLNGVPEFGVHPEDSASRGRVEVEFWMLGDRALPTDRGLLDPTHG